MTAPVTARENLVEAVNNNGTIIGLINNQIDPLQKNIISQGTIQQNDSTMSAAISVESEYKPGKEEDSPKIFWREK